MTTYANMPLKWPVMALLMGLCVFGGQERALGLPDAQNGLLEGVDMADIPVITILLEAESEGLTGMVAVGEVIRNRARRERTTWAAVCLRDKQFSCWNSPDYVARRLAADNGRAYQRACKAWELSADSNTVGQSTHYHNASITPYWAKYKTPYKTIGAHKFYQGIA